MGATIYRTPLMKRRVQWMFPEPAFEISLMRPFRESGDSPLILFENGRITGFTAIERLSSSGEGNGKGQSPFPTPPP
jgi:hypothetical protein